MSYANRKQLSQNRTMAILLSALFTFAIGFVLASGLAYKVIKEQAEDLKTFDVEDEPPPPPEEPPPPPPDQPATPPPPQVAAPPPLVRVNVAPPEISTTPQLNLNPPVTVESKPTPPATKTCPDGRTVLAALACAPAISQKASAKGDVRSLIRGDDYPSSAQREGAEGSVIARLSIGPDGRVAGCSIVKSSGNNALDSTTCSVLTRRARFNPAKNDAGQATTDSYTTPTIRWVLQD